MQSGADMVIQTDLHVGVGGGNGTLLVDGTGTKLNTVLNDDLVIIGSGATGELTFSNGATGRLGPLSVGDGTASGSTGTLNVLSGATVTASEGNQLANGIQLTANGGATTTGTINVDGAGSSLTSLGASELVVGHASEGTATINVTGDGTFNSGTGAITVNPTGAINIGTGGTFNANAPMTIDGGSLIRDASGTIELGAGRTLTATNNAQLDFGGNYELKDDNTFDLQSGADLTVANFLDVGFSNVGDGTLMVDGAGTSVTANTNTTHHVWGSDGGDAVVTFRNNAIGTLGPVGLAPVPDPGSTATLNVESGATVTTGNLNLANLGGAVTATINVDGADSSLAQTGDASLVVGHASQGTAAINVTDDGTLSSGTGNTTVRATGTVNIGNDGTGGTLEANGPMFVAGAVNVGNGVLRAKDAVTITDGTVEIDSGSLDARGAAGLLGNDVTVSGAGVLDVENGGLIDLSGGRGVSSSKTGKMGGTFAVTSGTFDLRIGSTLRSRGGNGVDGILGGSHGASGTVLLSGGVSNLAGVVNLSGREGGGFRTPQAGGKYAG